MITVQARLGDRAFTKQKLRVRARVAARTVNCFDPGRFERFIRECSGEIADDDFDGKLAEDPA